MRGRFVATSLGDLSERGRRKNRTVGPENAAGPDSSGSMRRRSGKA